MRRTTSLLAAGGLAAGLLAGTTGVAAQTAPGPVDFAPVCINTPAASPFTDVAANSTEQSRAIRCVAFAGIALGTGAGTTFQPGLSTNRGQMASFVARTLDLVDDLAVDDADIADLAAYDGTNDFTDVPPASAHLEAINRLADADIVQGGPGGAPARTYGEVLTVNRGQMAAFLARSYEHLTGEALPAGPDAFDDDDGTTHEDAIDRVAAAGIAQGLTSANFGWDQPVSRAQMALFLARFVGLFEQLGLIEPIPTGTEDGQVGDLAFAPFTPARLVDADGVQETSAADNRTYTATGLDAASTYRITLVEAANVDIADGEATFEEDGTSGLALAGDVGGGIVGVNGAAVARAQSVGAVVPQSGTVTVVVDAATAGRLLPVIYTDEGGDDTRLNLDDAGAPTEPYGVAGLLTTLPAEASAGPVAGDQEVVFVDTDEDDFATEADNGTQRLYEYDANDRFAVLEPGADTPTVLTLAQFEFLLSTGDVLDSTSVYSPDPAGVSSFVLVDGDDGGEGPVGDGPQLVSAELEGALLSNTVVLTFDEELGDELGEAGAGGVTVSGTVLGLLGVPLLQEGTGTAATIDGNTLTVTLSNPLVLNLLVLTPYEVIVEPGVVTDADGDPNPLGRLDVG